MTHCVSSSALRDADDAESSSIVARSDAAVVSSVVSRPREAALAATAPIAWAAAVRMFWKKALNVCEKVFKECTR